MSYKLQSVLARDFGVQLRMTACAATMKMKNPDTWAARSMWQMSAQPGLVEAYEDSYGENFGYNDANITDEMIATAVVNILAEEGA